MQKLMPIDEDHHAPVAFTEVAEISLQPEPSSQQKMLVTEKDSALANVETEQLVSRLQAMRL